MMARHFTVGDRVQGPIGSFGNVTRIDGGTVYVTYFERGGEAHSIYTPAWFRRWGSTDLLKLVDRK